MTEWFTGQNMILLAAMAIAAVFVVVLICLAARPLPRKIESRIRKRRYISQEDFFASWKDDKKDYPGCYVILIYDKKLILQPMHYDDIYVGQSVNVRRRVFNHLMGHGNGNVYFGLKSGCKVYIIINKCSRKRLNRAEKELIAHFHATTSLNMTRGGAPRR